MPRDIHVGLGEKPLSPGELEQLLMGFEEVFRRVLRRRLGRRLSEFDLTIEAELVDGGRGLSLRVEARAAGRLIAPLSYDEVLAEAIEEAGRWLREQLLRRVGAEEIRG